MICHVVKEAGRHLVAPVRCVRRSGWRELCQGVEVVNHMDCVLVGRRNCLKELSVNHPAIFSHADKTFICIALPRKRNGKWWPCWCEVHAYWRTDTHFLSDIKHELCTMCLHIYPCYIQVRYTLRKVQTCTPACGLKL